MHPFGCQADRLQMTTRSARWNDGQGKAAAIFWGAYMRAPLVSILIPVYNGEPFLAECIDSVLAQDFADYELLISDDGSTDGSSGVIRRHAERDGRIRWWRNPRNLGIGGNFNACLKAARGEYVKYVLQDDKLLDPSAVRRLVATLQGDPTLSLVVSASQRIDAESRLIRIRDCFGRSGVWEGKEVIARCVGENGNLIGEPSLALFRRAQAARGFDEGLRQLLDLELWFHLLEQGRFAYIAEPLCAFREHAAQQSEVNWRSGLAAEEDVTLIERYYFKPWMKDFITPQAIFTQVYYLRKRRRERPAALAAAMARDLSRRTYVFCWLRHKLTRPFCNLRLWLEKRRVFG
jgi:glycosyltransferase involved in cell wall biosynthesis